MKSFLGIAQSQIFTGQYSQYGRKTKLGKMLLKNSGATIPASVVQTDCSRGLHVQHGAVLTDEQTGSAARCKFPSKGFRLAGIVLTCSQASTHHVTKLYHTLLYHTTNVIPGHARVQHKLLPFTIPKKKNTTPYHATGFNSFPRHSKGVCSPSFEFATRQLIQSDTNSNPLVVLLLGQLN